MSKGMCELCMPKGHEHAQKAEKCVCNIITLHLGFYSLRNKNLVISGRLKGYYDRMCNKTVRFKQNLVSSGTRICEPVIHSPPLNVFYMPYISSHETNAPNDHVIKLVSQTHDEIITNQEINIKPLYGHQNVFHLCHVRRLKRGNFLV